MTLVLQWRQPAAPLVLRWRGPEERVMAALARNPETPVAAVIGMPGRDADAIETIDGGTFN